MPYALTIQLGAAAAAPSKSSEPLPVVGASASPLTQACPGQIKNAAAADDVGLLQPTLRRFLAGRCSMLAFGLPPLQVLFKAHAGGECSDAAHICVLAMMLLQSMCFGGGSTSCRHQDERTFALSLAVWLWNDVGSPVV